MFRLKSPPPITHTPPPEDEVFLPSGDVFEEPGENIDNHDQQIKNILINYLDRMGHKQGTPMEQRFNELSQNTVEELMKLCTSSDGFKDSDLYFIKTLIEKSSPQPSPTSSAASTPFASRESSYNNFDEEQKGLTRTFSSTVRSYPFNPDTLLNASKIAGNHPYGSLERLSTEKKDNNTQTILERLQQATSSQRGVS